MKEFVKRTLWTLLGILFFKLGQNVAIPGGIENEAAQVLEMVSGSSLRTFSIFTLGVAPYISASLTVSLLSMGISPAFKKMKEEGEKGRKKLNKIMRVFALILAFIQSWALTTNFIDIILMTAGFTATMWIVDLITDKGLGNGLSIIIFTNILTHVPNNLLSNNLIVLIVYLLMIVAIVVLEYIEKRIPIQQSNRVVYNKNLSYISFKVNSASILPVIFVSLFFSVLTIIFGEHSLFAPNNNLGICIYFVCIFSLSIVYTFTLINPQQISDELASCGTYVVGIYPGKDTYEYLRKNLLKTSLIGGISIAVLALLPNFLYVNGIIDNLLLNGSELIIFVCVAVDLFENIRAIFNKRKYDHYRGLKNSHHC